MTQAVARLFVVRPIVDRPMVYKSAIKLTFGRTTKCRITIRPIPLELLFDQLLTVGSKIESTKCYSTKCYSTKCCFELFDQLYFEMYLSKPFQAVVVDV